MKRVHLLAVIMIVVAALLGPELAMAADGVQLPNWANGGSNMESDLSQKGQKVANIISLIVGILSILGMLAGAAHFPMNKPDEGKRFLFYSIIGLVVAGSVYGIAAIFV